MTWLNLQHIYLYNIYIYMCVCCMMRTICSILDSHKTIMAQSLRAFQERFPEMQRVLHHSEVRGPEAFPYIDPWWKIMN